MGMEKAFFHFWNPISAPIGLDEFGKLALMGKIDISGLTGMHHLLISDSACNWPELLEVGGNSTAGFSLFTSHPLRFSRF
jgi:hypothetical protein